MPKAKLIGFVLAASGLVDIVVGALLVEGPTRWVLMSTGAIAILIGAFFLTRGGNGTGQ